MRDATEFYERIWQESIPIDARAVGVVVGEPTTTQFEVVLVRSVKRSQYVVAECDGVDLLGKVEELRTINVSFPDSGTVSLRDSPRRNHNPNSTNTGTGCQLA